jgi:hypothetical protein
MRNEDAVVVRRAGGGLDIQMPPVPGEARVRWMLLRAPGSIDFHALPIRVVIGGLGPMRIVSQMKLPRAVDRHNAFAHALDYQRGRGRVARPGCGVWGGLLSGDRGGKQQK